MLLGQSVFEIYDSRLNIKFTPDLITFSEVSESGINSLVVKACFVP